MKQLEMWLIDFSNYLFDIWFKMKTIIFTLCLQIKNHYLEKKRGYLLAILGGSIGGPFGWITSPLVLYVLNKKVKSKDGSQPNIFKLWGLLGLMEHT